MNRVLCIWLPEWPIQRLVVARPEHKSTPLILHARDARRGRRVIACCQRASQRGVRIDMPLAEVAALEKHANQSRTNQSRSNQGMTFQEYTPEEDLQALKELAAWCEQFSPIVGLEAADVPSCLLLDVTGLAPIFGSEQRLVQLAFKAFQQRGYQIRAAVANTVGAAWALAHYSQDCLANGSETDFASQPDPDSCPDVDAVPPALASSPVVADVASDTNDTNDTSYANDADRLAPLPIAALRLPGETVNTLQQLGVETISQLMQLPRAGLATRLGDSLVKRLDQAIGKHSEVIVAHRPPPSFEAEWILEHPTERRDAIETILRQLTDQVATTLAKSDHALVQAEASLEGKELTRSLTVSLFQPSSNPQHIYELFLLQLESFQMRKPIHRVCVSATTTVKVSGEQCGLWDDVEVNGQREIGMLVDRLSSRLGKECVFGVQAQAGALPERAYRKKPLADTMKSRRRQTVTANSLKSPHRPLWLQEPPYSLQMFSLSTGQHGRTPGQFQFQNCQHQVARHWGPERIETGWWRGRTVRRDYYRVETTNGNRFWIFRQLSDGAWFLHGCFE